MAYLQDIYRAILTGSYSERRSAITMKQETEDQRHIRKRSDFINPLINRDICKLDMPVDLYRAYGQYHYGIFADGNPYPVGMHDDNGLLNKKYQSLN